MSELVPCPAAWEAYGLDPYCPKTALPGIVGEPGMWLIVAYLEAENAVEGEEGRKFSDGFGGWRELRPARHGETTWHKP